MDNLAHLNHRKRKADNDDCSDPASVSADPLRPPDPAVTAAAPAPGLLNAPRQPCLASDRDEALWTSSPPAPSSPLAARTDLQDLPSDTHATKRPRLGKLRISSRSKTSRRSPTIKSSPAKSPTARQGNDIEDIGIVPTADPGPSNGSLIRARHVSSCEATNAQRPWPTCVPFDRATLPIPPPQPLINRQTLKELDLDAILRNPQLRHDLLFDPGLQFRPTGSRKKREIAERYWAAIIQEVERGCTCTTFDARRKPRRPLVGSDLYTARTPSRVSALLNEFLEVLLLVIQPLCNISGIYVNPNTFKTQMLEHSAQATYIRSIFDPILIEQELRHNAFDPSGLFRTIGETLKGHCAPMRDRSVEEMIRIAEQCGSGAQDAIKAIRLCMEILELMKLDIANHQLQTLRPFLLRTSGQFELRSLKGRYGAGFSLSATREWIEASHSALLQNPTVFHSLVPGKSLRYADLSGNQQLYVSVVHGIVDLIFTPPSIPCKQPAAPSPPAGNATSPSRPLFPETLYLDNARVLTLTCDATDTTALYMFLLLYRQLVFADKSNSTHGPPKPTDTDLTNLKCEIRAIAGAHRLGRCLSRNADGNVKEAEASWRVVKEAVVLQIAKRAKDVRTGHLSETSSTPSSTTGLSNRISDGPDERSLALSRNWADTNIQYGSPLSSMLHNRLRDVVFNAVLASTSLGRDLANGSRPIVLNFTITHDNAESAVGTATGMEPLADEIRMLAEKISLLALIHLNAYLPMYENEGFVPSH